MTNRSLYHTKFSCQSRHLHGTIVGTPWGDSSAWIQLVLTGITLIDITSWKPVEYGWYLDTILGYPINAAALYYGNANDRFRIIFNWVCRFEIVNQKIQELQANLLVKLQAEYPELVDNAEEN